MTIKDEEKNSSWIEVKEIAYMTRPQRSVTKGKDDYHHPYLTIGLYDWDDYEYSINFDPYDFIHWVDKETLQQLAEYIKQEIDRKL